MGAARRNRQIMLMIQIIMSLQKVFEQEAGSSGRNGSCNQGEIVARQARMTFGANAVPCPPSDQFVAVRQRKYST